MKKNVCLHYLPCSEDYKKQHCNSNASVHFATPFPTVNCQLSPVTWIHTFSAKEKDTETGLSYFGSRYYSSDLSIWLSVDPMSDKYPSLSPYVYCANNPIKLVDPNGEDIITIHRDGSYSIKEKKGRDVLVSTESLRINHPCHYRHYHYVVQNGDSWEIIAFRIGTTKEILQSMLGRDYFVSPQKGDILEISYEIEQRNLKIASLKFRHFSLR